MPFAAALGPQLPEFLAAVDDGRAVWTVPG